MAITLEEMSQGYIQSIQFRIDRAEKEIQEGKQQIARAKRAPAEIVKIRCNLSSFIIKKCSDCKTHEMRTTDFQLGNRQGI